jgi:hypothetical protein
MIKNWFIIILTLSVVFSGYTQKNRYGIFCDYKFQETEHSSEEVASNVLKIFNNTNKTYTVELQTIAPANWQMIGAKTKTLKISANDSTFVPVRIIPEKNSQGNTNYVVTSSLMINGSPIYSSNWNIKIEKISMWTCSTSGNNIYYSVISDTSDFSIQLRNMGNSPEIVHINLKPTIDLIILDTNGLPCEKEIMANLKPGDFKEYFYKSTPIKRESNPETRQSNENEEQKYSLRIQAKSINSDGSPSKSWNGNIDFISLPNQLYENEKSYRSLPLKIDFNTFNILSDNTFLTLDMYGNQNFKNNGQLVYYYQTNFTSNFLNARSYLGRFHYLGYSDNRYELSLGSVNSSRQGSVLSGNGIKASIKNDNHKLEGMFVKGPFFFEHNFLTGYALNYLYQNKFWIIDNYVQRKENTAIKVNSNIFQHDLGIKMSRFQNLNLGIALSTEEHYFIQNDIKNVAGYLFKFNYNQTIKNFRFSLASRYASKNYSEFRGIQTYQFNSFYRVNKKFNMFLSYNRIEHNPEYYQKGLVVPGDFYSRKDVMSMRLSYITKYSNVIITPQVQDFDYLGLKTFTKILNIDYQQRTTRSFIFYATAIGGYIDAKEYNMPEFFVASLRGTIRYKLLSLNLRYYYGPYFTREQVEFVQNELNPQRIFINFLYDYWFPNNQTLIRMTANYNNNILYKRALLSMRPEVFHYTKNGFRLSLYTRLVYFSQGDMIDINSPTGEDIDETAQATNFEVGFGIRKNIGFPISFKKYYDLKVIVYKDINGNGKRDLDEPGVYDVMLNIKKIDSNILETDELYLENKDIQTITNKKGLAVFNNLEMGNYILVSTPVNNENSFSNSKQFRIEHTHDREIEIAMSRGAKLSGSIFLEREKFANENKNVILTNIRVTAMDSSGNTFSTLTNANGQFNMFLPAGNYDIIVNQGVLGKRFEFVQNKISVHINNNVSNYNISFYVREKQRKINIKKF